MENLDIAVRNLDIDVDDLHIDVVDHHIDVSNLVVDDADLDFVQALRLCAFIEGDMHVWTGETVSWVVIWRAHTPPSQGVRSSRPQALGRPRPSAVRADVEIHRHSCLREVRL